MIARIASYTQHTAKMDEETKAVEKLLADTINSTAKDSTTITPVAPYTNDSSKNLDDNSTQNSADTSTVVQAPDDTTNVFEVKWVTGITQYKSVLILFSDKTGKMRVKYFAHGQTNTIEETMKFENTDQGTCLTGYDPVYAGTQTSCSTYYPDNLFISQDENGNATFTCVDDSGQTSKCTVTTINGYQNKQNFLADFNWKLD